jgi:DNA modification methylase
MPARVINAHCLDALPEVPELDLIATDPPYAFSVRKSVSGCCSS